MFGAILITNNRLEGNMKRYNYPTRVLVEFDVNGDVKPAYFLLPSGRRARVDSILYRDEARFGYRTYTCFGLSFEQRFALLYWDKVRNKWFLIKEGMI